MTKIQRQVIEKHGGAAGDELGRMFVSSKLPKQQRIEAGRVFADILKLMADAHLNDAQGELVNRLMGTLVQRYDQFSAVMDHVSS